MRLGLTVQAWDEDGLGPTRGMLIRLSSGTVVLMRELEHAIKHLGAKGPEFDVDASDAVTAGVEPLVSEILDSLGLTRDAVVWMADTEQLRASWSAWLASG